MRLVPTLLLELIEVALEPTEAQFTFQAFPVLGGGAAAVADWALRIAFAVSFFGSAFTLVTGC